MAARRESLHAALEGVLSGEERDRLGVELLELAIRPGLGGRAGPWARRWAWKRRCQADESLVRIASHYVSLGAELRDHLRAIGTGRWQELGGALDNMGSGRGAIAMLASATGDAALVERLDGLLEDPDEQVRAHSDQALLGLAARCVGIELDAVRPDLSLAAGEVYPGGGGGGDGGPLDRRAIRSAVRRGVARFGEHHRRGVALAGLLLLAMDRSCGDMGAEMGTNTGANMGADMGAQMRAGTVGDEGVQGMRGVLRWSRSPATRQCALRLLDHPKYDAASRDRFSKAHTLEDHETVLRAWHLALAPARRARLGQIEVSASATPVDASAHGEAFVRLTLDRDGAMPDGSWLEELSPRARAGVATYTSALACDELAARALLDPLLGDADGFVRLRACAVACERTRIDFCFDSSRPVARHAMTRLSMLGAAHDRTRPVDRHTLDAIGRLTRSEHASVRRIAGEDLSQIEPYRDASPRSVLRARRHWQSDPEAMLIELRHVLMGGSASSRVAALACAVRMGITREIESLLVTLIGQSPDDRVVASCVAALGHCAGELGEDVLGRAIAHDDARVRANAVEAIARRRMAQEPSGGSGQLRSMLTELRGDAHQRVRGNAVRALMALGEPKGGEALYTPSASSALIAMLRDERAAHRLSALWVAERSNQGGTIGTTEAQQALVGHVQTLAGMDPDLVVRARAGRVFHRFSARRVVLGSSGNGQRPDNTADLSSEIT